LQLNRLSLGVYTVRLMIDLRVGLTRRTNRLGRRSHRVNATRQGTVVQQCGDC